MKTELAKLKRETIPPTRHASDQRARMRRCLGRVAQEIWKTHFGEDLAPAARYAEEGFPVSGIDSLLLAVGP